MNTNKVNLSNYPPDFHENTGPFGSVNDINRCRRVGIKGNKYIIYVFDAVSGKLLDTIETVKCDTNKPKDQ